MPASRIADDLAEAARRTLAARSPDILLGMVQRGCWIYGAGSYGRMVYALLTARGVPCYGFIDRRADRLADAGLPAPVVSIDVINPAMAANSAVVIALHNYAADQAPVAAWARSCGFGAILLPAELPDMLGQEAASYWLTGRAHTRDHIDSIVELVGMLGDVRSVETVAALARFRITGDIRDHPAADITDQYFPRDLPLPAEPLRLVDGGAFVGEAYEDVRRAGTTLAEWYAFEPDPANFRMLIETARNAAVNRVALYPCGLGSECGQVHFSAGDLAGSRIVERGGDTVIQVVALDDVLSGFEPNFVKLDIEGAERAALDGMRNMLCRSRPQLAVSIYHQPEDLWELPFKVREMLPNASLYIRQHGFNGFDTVLYAIS